MHKHSSQMALTACATNLCVALARETEPSFEVVRGVQCSYKEKKFCIQHSQIFCPKSANTIDRCLIDMHPCY